MQARDFATKAESKADTIDLPSSRRITSIETLERALNEVGGNIVAGIFYADAETVFLLRQHETYPTIRCVVLRRISVKIVYELMHQATVAAA